jgi:hypothetical protein
VSAARIAAVIVGTAGVVALVMAYTLLQSRVEMIRKWKPVEARVLRAWMEQRKSGNSGEEFTAYSARYQLAYAVDGKSITSEAKSDDQFIVQPDQVQKRLDRHGVGTRGTVYVNPDDPNQVRLNLAMDVHTLAASLWVGLAGISLLLIGASLWLMGTPKVLW